MIGHVLGFGKSRVFNCICLLHLSDQFISINICILMCSLVSNMYITLDNATKYPSGYPIIVVIPIFDYLNRGNSFKDHI